MDNQITQRKLACTGRPRVSYPWRSPSKGTTFIASFNTRLEESHSLKWLELNYEIVKSRWENISNPRLEQWSQNFRKFCFAAEKWKQKVELIVQREWQQWRDQRVSLSATRASVTIKSTQFRITDRLNVSSTAWWKESIDSNTQAQGEANRRCLEGWGPTRRISLGKRRKEQRAQTSLLKAVKCNIFQKRANWDRGDYAKVSKTSDRLN